MSFLLDLAAATNPSAMSLRQWSLLLFVGGIVYLRAISTLSKPSKAGTTPQHGLVLRVLYGLFSTRVAEWVLARMLHTRADEPQAEQNGGTTAIVIGSPEMRIKVIPVLGGAFGGNYAYLVWDSTDDAKRAIAIDPADPYPVIRAAQEEG
eukprot:CAMPEP_0183336998 /NCGR_PEP_ID=MMETSP0164_2-20130417/4816_1 /TAXON_ID=221442 /ORGANISM="Coccolithus pelagicus ssp braarudi, Strain PLY182g" /LENGTH=149 /DNA_ID=CAMNT_0025506635 /DNA_START=66 /DNA_END=511 /DNA_ORIENTATION=-